MLIRLMQVTTTIMLFIDNAKSRKIVHLIDETMEKNFGTIDQVSYIELTQKSVNIVLKEDDHRVGMRCIVNLNLKPKTVEWFKNNNSIEFNSLDLSDMGSYLCKACNDFKCV